MLHAHRPIGIVGRGGGGGGGDAGFTASGSRQQEVTSRGVDSATPPGDQHQMDVGYHSQRIDAICNNLNRNGECQSLGGVVVKQERTDDSGDTNGYPALQRAGNVGSGTERKSGNVDNYQTTSVLPGIHEAFSHRSPFQQLSPTLAGVPVATTGVFSHSAPDFGQQASVSRQPENGASHPATFLSFPMAAQSQSPRRRPTAQLPPIAQVSSYNNNYIYNLFKISNTLSK